ncbi:hypothetical protein, partial [Blautia wexlerae]|uniref:hypothetical protein n=1 Tax=Blautia wexlerae TaxID=418240 RepID=UPI0019661806
KWGDFNYEQRKSLEKSRLRIPRRYNFLRGGDKIREGTRRESVSFLCAGYWMCGDLYDLQVMFLVLNNCASHSRYFRKKVIPASAVRCHRK